MSLTNNRAAARAAYAEILRNPQPQTVPIRGEPSVLQRQAIGWERSTPRCETCRHFTAEKTIVNKQTLTMPVVIAPPICKRGRFNTKAGALCDHWIGADGSTLQQ